MIWLIFMKTLYLWSIKSIMKNTILILVLISLFSCNHNTIERFNPLGEIPLPDSTLFTAQNIELGRKMFFDTRLSLDNKVSCATCHKPEYAFADKAPVTLGVRARQGSRNAPSLMNVGYLPHMMAEGMVKSLEMQMLDPLQDETEMSMDLNQLVNKLKTDSFYVQQAKEIYGRELDMFVVTRAISAYQRTLISNHSAFDQYYYHKDDKAISSSAKRGWKLFSEELYCTECHTPPMFTNFDLANNGLYVSFQYTDKGKFRATLDTNDMAKFKIPSLRNVTLTAPYMHNGQFFTLKQVLENYKQGGAGHFNQSPIIQPFTLTQNQEDDLIHFFETLVDTVSYKTNQLQ